MTKSTVRFQGWPGRAARPRQEAPTDAHQALGPRGHRRRSGADARRLRRRRRRCRQRHDGGRRRHDRGAGRRPTTATTRPHADGEHPTVAVDGVDYGYENLPAEIEAGTTLTFTNTSDAEFHEMVVIRIPDTETRSVPELALLAAGGERRHLRQLDAGARQRRRAGRGGHARRRRRRHQRAGPLRGRVLHPRSAPIRRRSSTRCRPSRARRRTSVTARRTSRPACTPSSPSRPEPVRRAGPPTRGLARRDERAVDDEPLDGGQARRQPLVGPGSTDRRR